MGWTVKTIARTTDSYISIHSPNSICILWHPVVLAFHKSMQSNLWNGYPGCEISGNPSTSCCCCYCYCCWWYLPVSLADVSAAAAGCPPRPHFHRASPSALGRRRPCDADAQTHIPCCQLKACVFTYVYDVPLADCGNGNRTVQLVVWVTTCLENVSCQESLREFYKTLFVNIGTEL